MPGSTFGATLTSANSYFNTERLNADAWENASEENRNRALNQAANLIDGAFEFYDSAKNEDGSWNERVLKAVYEEAIYLLTVDPTTLPDSLTKGLSQASAGSASASFDKSFVAPLICNAARRLIGTLGAYIDSDELGTITVESLGV